MKTKTTILMIFNVLICIAASAQQYDLEDQICNYSDPHGFNSVSISGDYAFVGDSKDEINLDESSWEYIALGAVHVYKRNNSGKWVLNQKLIPSDRNINKNDLFGSSVCIVGNYAVVGAPGSFENEGGIFKKCAGAAYIFEKDNNGLWHEVQKITPKTEYRSESDRFGYSVSLSSNTVKDIVVGAPGAHIYTSEGIQTNAGRLYCFKQDGTNWIPSGSFFRANSPHSGDQFGFSVDISGNKVVVGAPGQDYSTTESAYVKNAGAVYIFTRLFESSDWNYKPSKICSPQRKINDKFGYSVAISGNLALAGAPYNEYGGLAYAMDIGFIENSLVIFTKLQPEIQETDDRFGYSVDVSNRIIIVGEPNNPRPAEPESNTYYKPFDAGAAYVFQKTNDQIEQIQKITSTHNVVGDFFGNSVCASDNQIFIAASGKDLYYANNNQYTASSGYIYTHCVSSSIDDPDNIIVNGDFGSCSTAPWRLDEFSGASGALSLENGQLELKDISITNDPIYWHLQLIQPFSQEQINRLKTGNIYRLSFTASAEKDNRPCVVYFGQDGPPYNGAIKDEEVRLSKEMKYYELDFSLTEIYPSMYLALEFGMEVSSVTIDDVRLERIGKDTDGDLVEDVNDNCPYKANPNQADSDNDGVGNTCDNCPHTSNANQLDSDNNGIGDACETHSTGIDNNSDFENSINIYPNPARDYLKITAEVGSIVSIYNIAGALILRDIINNKLINFDISGFAKGIYIVEVRKENCFTNRKVIFQ